MSSAMCFYHPQQSITVFCLHPGCILPLCSSCQLTHRRDPGSGEHRSLIVPYSQAKQIAISAIERECQSVQQTQKDFHSKFIEFRAKMLQVVQQSLWNIEEKLSKQSYEFESSKEQLGSRKRSIEEGSLKELINHYEKGSGYEKSGTVFQFNISEDSINKCMQSCYSFKNQSPVQKDKGNKEKQVTGASEMQSSRCLEDEIQGDLGDSVASRKEKRKRRGIFVASSPQINSEIKKYSSCEKFNNKTVKKKEGVTNQKCQSVKNSRIFAEKHKNKLCHEFSYSVKDFSQPSLIRPHSDKRLKISHKQCTQNRFGKILIETSNTQVEQCEKWRKVVNTKDLSRISHNHSRLTLENMQDDIMNPKQMRDLIMKKRNQNQGSIGVALKPRQL